MATTTSPLPAASGPDAPHRWPRRATWRAYALTALGLVIVVALLASLKGAQIGRLIGWGKKAAAAGPPPETVNTFVAQHESWEDTLRSVGSVTAARGVTISNDAAGIVWKIHFESGQTVAAGAVLVELDTRVERAQLASAQARATLAASNLARTRTLVTGGAIGAAQLDTDSAQLAGAKADADALAEQIERKIVRAPFAGKLGIRLVNVGQYLAPGTAIADLESSEATYVDFDLPQQDMPRLHVGTPVRLSIAASEGAGLSQSADGAIAAVSPDVDPTTRNVRVRASVSAKADWLRPGMFVDVGVVEPQKVAVVAVPQTAIVQAPYGDSVFVVEHEPGGRAVAREHFVQLGAERGDFVAVAHGLDGGQEVVSEGAFKLRNGARVNVDNRVQPQPQLAPNPPNR